MILFLLSYLGGVLTILSPCILPVLPFVFARADKPFLRSGLPLLAGMALSFAAIATLASFGGAWAVQANQAGRFAAMALLALFGLSLLLPALAQRLTQPLVALGNRLSNGTQASEGMGSALLLGLATGLLWAPCAGPILGLILTAAAINGASASTSLLLLAYAAGAATSLGLALLAGGKVFAAMKRSLGAGEWVRRGLGVLVLAGVAAIALGLDTGLLARLSQAQTASLEQALINTAGLGRKVENVPVAGSDLAAQGVMPPLTGATRWLNSPPLSPQSLRGKVVVVDFWTYSCINCIRAMPYVRAWAQKYAAQGLVVIGIHTPEFAFEKVEANVRRAMADLGVDWPVAQDNDFAVWKAFNNQYWPAHYFIDAQGRIRHHHFGEGDTDRSEQVIQQLLREAGHTDVPGGLVDPKADGAQAAPDFARVKSPETYIGYNRGVNFTATPFPVKHDQPADYRTAATLTLNQWGLDGRWTIGAEMSRLEQAGGKITFRFEARDVHLVLGPSAGKNVRFRVTLDGKPPRDAHGADIDAQGVGSVTSERLYQLIRQKGRIIPRTFQIEFRDPGVQAFAFTFG